MAKERGYNYIAVDFDGTVVNHVYPYIGEDLPYAVYVLKELKKMGFKLILNTMRSGQELEPAVEWFEDRGIFLSGINVNPQQTYWTQSQKVYANFYIDDCGVGCPVVLDSNGRNAVDWLRIAIIFGIEIPEGTV